MNARNLAINVLLLFMVLGIAFATTSIQTGLKCLYCQINNLLGIVIFLLVIAAAVVYAGGQILGAETRARATVWATSMFMGAIIGVALYLILPAMLKAMLPSLSSVNLVC